MRTRFTLETVDTQGFDDLFDADWNAETWNLCPMCNCEVDLADKRCTGCGEVIDLPVREEPLTIWELV